MSQFSIFEMVMLICFGAAWPFSLLKSWRSRSNAGKSVIFLYVIFVGYVAGVLHKLFYAPDTVIVLYTLNGLMVLGDILLYYRNARVKPDTTKTAQDLVTPWHTPPCVILTLACVLAAASLFGITVTLRNGHQVSGSVVQMDDTNLIFKTTAGIKTYAWHQLSNQSIKQINPGLYHRLLTQAHARIHLNTQILHHAASGARASLLEKDTSSTTLSGLARPTLDLAQIKLNVSTSIKRGEKVRLTPSQKQRLRKLGWDDADLWQYYGVLTIALDNLAPSRVYTIRAQATLHYDRKITGDVRSKSDFRQKVSCNATQIITNASRARLNPRTPPFEQGYWRSTENRSQARIDADVRYWDISIWINDVLVYQEKDNKTRKYYHVQKW